MARSLAVFDFDQTLIDNNDDAAIMQLVNMKTIPEDILALYRQEGWTAFTQGIFKFLHQNNIDQRTITNFFENLTPITGMIELIHELISHNFQVIIMSDSNTYIIETWLKKHQLERKVSKVFANPSEFRNGMLRVSLFPLKECYLSSKNSLCKGHILEGFIREQRNIGVIYDRVVYCGDGSNDFCPILRLGPEDLACVRNKYKCEELINKAQKGESFDPAGNPHIIKAKVLVWDNGEDILKRIQEWL